MLGMKSASPGSSFGDVRMRCGFGELGKALQIGLREVHEADGLIAGREIQRPDIKIRQLLGRKQGEAPMTDDDAGDVIGQIMMSSDARAIAEPECSLVAGDPRSPSRSGCETPAGKVSTVVEPT